MKFKLLSLGCLALACAALTACSSDEPKGGNPDNPDANAGDSFASFRIASTGGSSSRGTTDYVNGTDIENQVKNATFVFYNGGQYVSMSNAVLTPWTTPNPQTGTVEKYWQTTINVPAALKLPGQVIVILNKPTGLTVDHKSLDALRKELIGQYSWQEGDKTYFVMSNSAYKDAQSAIVYPTIITQANIKTSQSEAEDAPIDVYVERVASKVNVKKADDFAAEFVEIPMMDENGGFDLNNKTKLTPVVKGFAIANVINAASVVKDIDQTTPAWATWMNDAANHRSYWAATASLGTSFGTNQTSAFIANSAYKDITSTNIADKYIMPNTLGYDPTITPGTPTKATVVVAACELQDAQGKAYPFIKVGGAYAPVGKNQDNTENFSIFLNYCAGMAFNSGIGYKVPSSTTPDALMMIPAENYEVVEPTSANNNRNLAQGSDFQVHFQLKTLPVVEDANGQALALKFYNNGTEITFDANATDAQKIAAINAVINPVNNDVTTWMISGNYYKDGKTYYFTPILQNVGQTVTDSEYIPAGVVRNHVYNVEVEKVKGLGTPVFDSTWPIIPDRPIDDVNSYLSVKVNILQWRIVSQKATLE